MWKILIKLKFLKAKLLGEVTLNPLYYVNSPQTLPPPLSKEEEERLTGLLDTGDKKARDTLVEHNLRLVVYIAKKFENSGVNIEDLVSIGTIGLIKAVNTFKADKNIKLATYASRCVENEILMYLRKINQQKTDISLDEPLNVDWDGNELLLSDVLGTDGLEINDNIEGEDERRILYT
ncbi:MAG: sigma-70 family RNA polymerase sigma factor, partial [Oscillospiraceae bacterium]|nr:sigma-70 family RNA polymerase sigma factor [Oscillospiraceae bacterium]